MPWNIIVAALLVLAAAFGALGASLGLALLLGRARWPEAQADGLRWSGAVSRNPQHAALGDPTRESTDQARMLAINPQIRSLQKGPAVQGISAL